MTSMEEMNQNDKQQEYFSFAALFKTLWERRRVFYWLLPVTFVVSSALILCVPRYYTCEVTLAPESNEMSSSGSLQALASSFGFDLQSLTNDDALRPALYPDIIQSPNFLIGLFDVPVSTSDNSYSGTYYNYLRQYKLAFWKRWKVKILTLLMPTEDTPAGQRGDGVDVFCMSKQQWGVIQLMRSNITCKTDKKTDAITIGFTAQDKLVCATMADSVCAALQAFVTNYRTAKSRSDLSYYGQVMNDAYKEYQDASEQYTRYIDSHSGIKLEQYRIEAQRLESEMQLKHSVYTSFQKQYLATQARLQENTPVFTVIQSASVPLKPAGPKRMIFVLGMLVLATMIACCVICKDQLLALFALTER